MLEQLSYALLLLHTLIVNNPDRLQALAQTPIVYAEEAPTGLVAPHRGILDRIAWCESGSRQFNDDGTVVKSRTKDYGYYQINISHLKEAKSLGFDIFTEKGNKAYGEYLYSTQGTTPWNSSKKCWASQDSS